MVPVRIDSAVPHLALFASKDIIQVNANYYESEGSGGGAGRRWPHTGRYQIISVIISAVVNDLIKEIFL